MSRQLDLLKAESLDDQLGENQWDYLMWNVQPIGGPRLRKGTVLFIKHSAHGRRMLGWPLRYRPRWRAVRIPWRWDR